MARSDPRVKAPNSARPRVVQTPVQLQLVPGGPKGRPRAPKPPPSTTAPVWAPYRGVHPVKCDDCLAECGRDPAAPAARLAQRRLRGTGVDVLACYVHAEARGDTRLRRRRAG